jgi:hypothetical protein
MRGVFGKHLIRGPDQDVRVLGLEHEILIELFHDVIKARDGCAAFVARLDPDRASHCLMRRRTPYAEMMAFSRSCGASGILVHQNRAQFVAMCEVAHAAINPFNVRSFITSQELAAIRSTATLPSVRQCCTVRRRGMSGNKRK